MAANSIDSNNADTDTLTNTQTEDILASFTAVSAQATAAITTTYSGAAYVPATTLTSDSASLTSTTSYGSVTSTSNTGSVASTSSHNQSSRNNGASTGTLAGAAVGAAIGGAIIGVFLTWMLLRNRRHSRGNGIPFNRRSDEKDYTDVTVTEVSMDAMSQGYRWEMHLPQSADDSSLRFSAKTLFHQIELHVENFYSNSDRHSRTIPHDIQNKLDQFDSDCLPAAVVNVMQQTDTPVAVIKHCLAKYITSCIDLSDTSHASFLSAEYAILITAIRNGEFANKPGAREAFSKWRVLTAYLRSDSSDRAVSNTARDASIQHAATSFSSAFALWATTTQSERHRMQNLVEIMRNAAQFGDLIFSQASDFQYVWSPPSNGRNHSRTQSRNEVIVISPGLVKVTDEKAKPLEPGQVVLPSLTAQL